MLARAIAGLSFIVGLGISPTHADPTLGDVQYPYPVQHYELQSQRQSMAMAYMDIRPARPNGKSIVLLHGKNFCAAAWESVIPPLHDAGWRIIAPDQIGFCKSSKPQRYQFSLHQLAANTHGLLAQLGIARPVVVGHSMGGMLAMRYALMYGGDISGLVLVNPIGLEDWQAKGVPAATIDQLYARELKTGFDGIKQYQLNTYYAGQWRPEYDRWVNMLAGMYQEPGREVVAWSQALTSDMIFSQPVVHELDRIITPTLLLIGARDNTAIGKDRAAPELQKQLGNYPALARETQARITGSKLVLFPELGHAPQIQDSARFNAALMEGLGRF